MRGLGFAVDWAGGGRAASAVARMVRSPRAAEPTILASRDGIAAIGVGSAATGASLSSLGGGNILGAFEGRLDNISALRADLGLDSAASAATVLLSAYDRWADACVLRLRGDYAFVVWDGRDQKILAARDPFGVRPLHYATADRQLSIASEVDQILGAGFADAIPDDQMVVEFLMRDCQTLDRTFFRDISRVPPGHLLIATALETRTLDYRRPPVLKLSFSSTQECYEAFRDKFFTAVRRRLLVKAPVVVQLSGGLDSTSILCAADQMSDDRPQGIASVIAASAVFPGLPCDETSYIDAVSRHVRSPVFRWDGTFPSEVEFLEPLLAAPGDRIPWASGTEGYVGIARSHGAGTVLDGTGGDQIGLPLGTESDEFTRNDWRHVAQSLLMSNFSISQTLRVLRWTAGVTSPDWVRRFYRRAYRRLQNHDVPNWLAPQVSFRAHPGEQLPKGHSFLSDAQRTRWETLCAGPLARSVDAKQRHAAWSGLDMAFPFLDWDLVQFTLALPSQYWPVPRWRARLHREALRPDLPSEIYLRRSKAEFSSAMTNRVIKSIGIISDLLEGETWQAGRFIDQKLARRLLVSFRDAPSRKFVAVYHLWAIASVEAWLRRILSYRIDVVRGA